MPLPRAIQDTRGVALQVVDYQVRPLTGKLDSTGTAVVAYDGVDVDQLWRVERIIVSHTSVKQLTVFVYGTSDPKTPQPIDERDWTPLPAGFRGVTEYPRPLTILGGTFLAVKFAGGNQNDQVTVNAQWELVQRVPAGS